MKKNHHPFIGRNQVYLSDGSSYIEPSILLHQRCEYLSEKDITNHSLWDCEDFELLIQSRVQKQSVSTHIRRVKFNTKFGFKNK